MKSPTLLAFIGVSMLAGPASGTILLNEIHINPPPDLDLNYEYIELRSTTGGVEKCTDLTLLIIENNGGQVGEVEEALNLNDFSTGENGLLILGNGYDSSPQGGPWSGFKVPATTAYDPAGNPPWSGLGDDDLDPNGGLTFLLVTGWKGMSNQTGNSLGDVDVNNNGVLDWNEPSPPNGSQTTQPFTDLIDSVGYPDLGPPVRRPYTTADLNRRPVSAANFAPDNISRRLSRANYPADANNASAWYGGNLAGTSAASVTYDVQIFGDFRGQATPGQPNLDAPPVVGNFLINEVSIDPPGPETRNFEYIEIINADGGSGSLQGLTLVLLRTNDNSGGNPGGVPALGIIMEAWNLSAFTTGANGLLLLGNNYPDRDIPWAGYIEPETHLEDPTALGVGDIGPSEAFSLLLVENYTGVIGQDLDTNNDGVLDISPWTAIKDSVGFDQLSPGIGKTYAQAKITSTPAYEIDNLSRKLGNTTANSAAAWYGGDFASAHPFGIGFLDSAERPAIGGFRGAATPGRANFNSTPPPADIRINEVMVDPVSNPDGSREYVELINTAHTIGGLYGLTLVIADGNPGAQNGAILESIDLSGLSTGPNGLLLIGDSYDDIIPYNILERLVSPLTLHDDVPGLDAAGVGDIGPNGAMLILITKGTPPAVGSNVSNIAATDIVDSIGFGATPNSAIATIAPGFTPQHLSRYPWTYAPNTPDSWFSGMLDPAFGESSLYYSGTFAGTYKGGASPGRYNHAATPGPTTTFLLNELHINPPGGDQSNEFIEYRAVPPASFSANGYTLLMLDGTGSNTGTVLEAWSLDGLATGTNGLLLTGAGYPDASPWTGANAPAPATRLGSPQFMSPGDIAGDSDNGTVSFLLVRNFNGMAGLDLDAGVPGTGTGADDGNFDVFPLPWSNPIADAVGIRLYDTSLQTPAYTGRVYGGVDLSSPAILGLQGYTPDNLSRHGDNNTPASIAAWYGGDIDGSTGTSTGYDPSQKFPASGFAGLVTPGRPNVGAAPADNEDGDNDGVVNLIEFALNMNPAVADPQKLPETGNELVDVGGTGYPFIKYTRFINGTSSGATYVANGFRYEVQVSLDLVTWSDAVTQVSTAAGEEGTESATYRPTNAFFQEALAAGGEVFIRLRISRA